MTMYEALPFDDFENVNYVPSGVVSSHGPHTLGGRKRACPFDPDASVPEIPTHQIADAAFCNVHSHISMGRLSEMSNRVADSPCLRLYGRL